MFAFIFDGFLSIGVLSSLPFSLTLTILSMFLLLLESPQNCRSIFRLRLLLVLLVPYLSRFSNTWMCGNSIYLTLACIILAVSSAYFLYKGWLRPTLFGYCYWFYCCCRWGIEWVSECKRGCLTVWEYIGL